MELLTYSNNREKKIKINPELYMESFRKKIQGKLNLMEASSDFHNHTITFNRSVRNSTHSGQNKIEALKILRQGWIRIEKADAHKIKIFWEVKLDGLVFLSIMIGHMIGLILGVAGLTVILALVPGLLFSVIAYLIGCALIKAKMDEMVESSM